MQSPIAPEDLQIVVRPVHDATFDDAAAGQREPFGDRRRGVSWTKRADERDEIRGLSGVDATERRHPGAREPVADDAAQFIIAAQRRTGGDCRTRLATIAIRAVAGGAAAHERLSPGIDTLGERCGRS